MVTDPRTPCLVGVAQRTWRRGGDPAPEPLGMAAEVVRAAVTDAGSHGGTGGAGPGRLLGAVQSLRVVHCMSWPYDDLPGRLAAELGIEPAEARLSGIGGTVPLELVDDLAARMLAGDLDVAVLCGAEALDTRRRALMAGEEPRWSHRATEEPPFPFPWPFHPAEVAHEVFQAWLTFAVRDVARRAALGIAPERYRDELGAMLAPLSETAAANPHAWFPVARTAAEITRPSASNRMVGYPYTKYMVAVMDVDMAAAVVVATHEAAERLGVPSERRVYLRGSGSASDPRYLAEHPDLARSPGLRRALGDALAGAGRGPGEVAHLDLYSCFGSSLHFATDALGLDPLTDGRRLSVTGGLPYAGGPASNYVTHALASMAEVLRDDPGSLGLVTGVGMHMTKHAAAALSTTPPSGLFRPAGPMPEPAAAAGGSRAELGGRPGGPGPGAVPIVDAYSGPARVAGYSVVHGRDGAPEWGLLVVDVLASGSESGRHGGESPGDGDGAGPRCYARVESADDLGALEAGEWVGRTVEVSGGDGGVNHARLTDRATGA